MKPKVVIFDLDGTITKPYLDFAKIRRQIGVSDGMMILEYLDSLEEPGRSEVRRKIDAWEADGARKSTLNPGVRELLALLAERNIRTAVLTRNTRVSVDTVIRKHGLRFDLVVAADDDLPVKPSPEPVRHIAKAFGVDPGEVMMVGDFRFDVECGRAAGAATVYLTNRKPLEENVDADLVIHEMTELVDLLRDQTPEGE